MKNLIKIKEKYSGLKHNSENYEIGGGLDFEKFASNRHEDANNDIGKITLGKANQMFKKATGLNVAIVKEIIFNSLDNIEWHHAGKLPKSYGGGMKKTYFLKAEQVVFLAENWIDLQKDFENLEAKKKEEQKQLENKEKRKLKFLKKWATFKERLSSEPKHFHITKREMQGKYGWFDSSTKDYNLQEYLSGWEFRSAKKLNEFIMNY